jgi:signal peptidase I
MRNSLAEWVFNVVVLVFATSTIAQPFVIPSGSMESTLMTGDHVIVDKLAYSPSDSVMKHILPYEDIQRGDVIVFRYPPDIRQNYVKRIVGMPGDRIALHNKRLYRNRQAVDEPYVQHVFSNFDPYRDDFPANPPVNLPALGQDMLKNNVEGGEVLVPAGMYFAMGDNRDNSEDSRYWGFVPRENIIGKPVLVFWSYDASYEDLTGYTLHHAIDLAEHFFSKTRWDRTFKPLRP